MAISLVGTQNQQVQQSQAATAQPRHHRHHGHKAQSSSTNQQDSVQIGDQQNINQAGTYSNPQYAKR
jgi:hypothetical protein